VYLRKARWILIGMFAPEIVAYAAWDQQQDAKRMTIYINEALEKVSFTNQEHITHHETKNSCSASEAELQAPAVV
jgi:hypothetical protein